MIPTPLIRAMVEEKARQASQDDKSSNKDWCRLECRSR